MIWNALATAFSSSVKWDDKSFWNFLDSSSIIREESVKSSLFSVIHGIFPFFPIGSSKSTCYLLKSDEHIFKNAEIYSPHFPRNVCQWCAGKSPVWLEKEKCLVCLCLSPNDAQSPHLFQKTPISSYQPKKFKLVKLIYSLLDHLKPNLP